MSITRYASIQVLSAYRGEDLIAQGKSVKTAHRHDFQYEVKPGFLYVRSRMISSRTNDNFDHFPAEEIKAAYRTFIGKPVFVNHDNANHRRARGVIKDAVLHEDVNPDGSPDVWVEGLMEVDATNFPKLAQAILAGEIDRTSMGTDVAFSVCSVCHNKASNPVEYCFPPGALVTLADGTFKPIEQVLDGDEVLTHDGVGTVSAVGERPWSDATISVKRAGYGFPVTMTDNHPCYIRRDGETDYGRVEAKDVRVGDWVKSTYPDTDSDFLIDVVSLASDFVTVSDTVILATPTTSGGKRRLSEDQISTIRSERAVGTAGAALARRFGVSQALISNIVAGKAYTSEPAPRIAWVKSGLPRFITSSPALSTLLGWYVAEGSVAGFTGQGTPKVVEWALSESEESVADEIDLALGKFGLPPARRYRPSPTCLIVKVSNAPLAALLAHLGGKTTNSTKSQKRLSPEVLTMPRDDQRLFLDAYCRGDGHWVKDHWTIRTASPILARQLVMVGARLFDHIPTVWENTNNPGGPTYRDRRFTIYHVDLGYDRPTQMKNKRRLDGPYYESRILKVEEGHFDGPVYDLTVDHQHTFMVEGMLGWNCKHIPKMKGQKIWRTTASGEKEGILVYEICYGLGFFENSLLVEEPADPTAFMLGVDARGLTMAASRHMDPGSTGLDHGDHPLTDAELLGYGSLGELPPARATLAGRRLEQQQADGPDVVFGQSTGRVGRADQAASSVHHVSGVLPVGAEQPVARVVAERHVAGVTDDLPFRDRADQGRVAPSVRPHAGSVVQDQSAVPVREGAPGPRPAGFGASAGVDLGPVPSKYSHEGQRTAALLAETVGGGSGAERRAASKIAASDTNPRNWALVARTALSAAEQAHERELLSRVRQNLPRGNTSKTIAVCTLCDWAGKVDRAVECPSCGDEDYTGRLVLPVGAETDLLSRHYVLPGLRNAACETCSWSGQVKDCARCPRCNSRNHMTFLKRKDYHGVRTASTYDYQVSLDCGDQVHYVGSTHGQVESGQDWTCTTHGETKVSDVNGPGTSNGLGMDKTSSRRTAGEEKVLAPADVDTLRDEACPVCAEKSAYDGEKCQVCGFIAPPSEFGDPDTDAAQQTDLRQQADDANDPGGDLKCDSCGETFSSTPQPAVKQAVVLDPEKGTDESDEAATVHSQAGDPCPTCGDGTLQPTATTPDAATADAEGFAPAGSGADQAAPDASEGDEKDDADDPDPADGSDDEDGENGDKPDFLKKKDRKKPTANRRRVTHEGGDVMRPALAALAAQQKQIEALSAANKSLHSAVAFIAKVAGIETHPQVTAALKTATDENPAFGGGWDNGAPAEGSPEAPIEGTEQASTPTAKDSVEDVGSTPLTDVTPDATTSLDSTEVVLDVTEPAEQDVTAPVAGTEDLGKGGRGQEGTNRIETDVRAGTPTDNSAAFRDGGFLGAKDEARTIASLRLARLQIQAGIAAGDDLDLGSTIAASSRGGASIQAEIETLAKVVTASKQPQRVARNLVPQGAGGAQRMVPSMTSDPGLVSTASIGSVGDDELLFE